MVQIIPIIAYRLSKNVFMYHLRVENRRSKGAYCVYTSTTGGVFETVVVVITITGIVITYTD